MAVIPGCRSLGDRGSDMGRLDEPSDAPQTLEVHANQIYKRKQELLQDVARVFEPKAGTAGSGSEASDREGELLRKIGSSP